MVTIKDIIKVINDNRTKIKYNNSNLSERMSTLQVGKVVLKLGYFETNKKHIFFK